MNSGSEQARSQPVLSMRGISKSFAGVQALKQVNFDVVAGEVHALLGENGAGKSTLMKILFGVERPDSGEIVLADHGAVSIANPRQALHLGIGLVSQELSLVPQLDVAQNIFLGQSAKFGSSFLVNREALCTAAKAIVEPLAPDLPIDAQVSSLSMAQRQVVEIGRTLARGAQIIAFDEPTSSLTPRERDGLFEIIRQLRAQGKSIIYISHRLPEIHEIADRATILRDGQLVTTRPTTELSSDEMVRLIVGRDLVNEIQQPLRHVGQLSERELLRVSDLSMGQKLHNINLTVKAGEILGLSGLVGSGRTELARCIFGAERMDHGAVFIDGQPVKITRPAEAIAAGLALVPEDRRSQALVPVMDIERNFGLPNYRYYAKYGFLKLKQRLQDIVHYIKEMTIRPSRSNVQVRWLSGGNQQKVVIARWLKSGARVLIFDEPTRGIDVGAKAEIHRLMRRLADEQCAVLMISSELPELLMVCDRIAVMREGRIAGIVNGAEATEEILMQYATGKVTAV